MTAFRCLPIPTATAERWRATGQDDRGNALIRRVADGPGFPCRHCLALARPGEAMLLGSFNLERPQGVYWTPSPIFLHAEPCPAFAAPNQLAETVRQNPLVSLRCYDAAGLVLYDLGLVLDGAEAEAPLRQRLADPRTAFVNIHTARPGCLLAVVERI
jgi:hypothetical protein